jgi:DNA-directed RNA polymerase specialized sigma24 family protein
MNAFILHKSGSLASWLYGVAWRVAHSCGQAWRGGAGLKGRRQHRRPARPRPRDDISFREVQRLVDEELNRLPAGYKGPLVLCYLEGKTQDEAAKELGWTLGDLQRRIDLLLASGKGEGT